MLIPAKQTGCGHEQRRENQGNPAHPSAHKHVPEFVLYSLILKTLLIFKNGGPFRVKLVDFSHFMLRRSLRNRAYCSADLR